MPVEPGRMLSHYRIVEKIGEGGMGVVYLAEDTKLKRRVALKVLPPEVATIPERLRRFRHEAEAVAALNHPGVVTIHSVEDAEGVHFFTMEFVQGKDLGSLIRRGGLKIDDLVEIALSLADALSAAHAKGIVHRDLKPANIMVSDDGRLKLLDFGLAKLRESEAANITAERTATALTAQGLIVGTAPYMSPEQIEGRTPDSRSDIFSFGVILHEMATGERPFKGETIAGLMSSILRDPAPSALELRPELPPPVGRIIRRCLEKEPERRFRAALDVRNELRDLKDEIDSPESATEVITGQATGSRARRKWWPVAVVAAVVLLTAAVLVLWQRNRAPDGLDSVAAAFPTAPKRIAVLPFQNLGPPEDEYFAAGMTDEVRTKLAALRTVQVIARGSADQYRETTKPPEQIAEELGVRFILTARVRWDRSNEGEGRIRLTPELIEVTGEAAPAIAWQGSYDAVLVDVFEVQSDVATQVARALDLSLAESDRHAFSERPTENLEAYRAFLRGREIRRERGLGRSRELAAEQYEYAVALDPDFGAAWASLAAIYSYVYAWIKPDPAMAERARYSAERARALGPERPESLMAMGSYYTYVQKDSQRALAEYLKGLEKAPNHVPLLVRAAVTERRLGRWENSVAHGRRAADLDPRSISANSSMAFTLRRLRRYDEAWEYVERLRLLAPANISRIENEVVWHLVQGDLSAARKVLRDAEGTVALPDLVAHFAVSGDLYWVLDDEQQEVLLRLTPAAFSDNVVDWALALSGTYWIRGEQDRVREYAERAREGCEQQLEGTPDDALLRAALGLVFAYLDRPDKSFRESERAVQLLPVSEDAVWGPWVQIQYVRACIVLGRHEEALDLLAPLLDIPYDGTPSWLSIDPNFAPLRGNPRFKRMVAERRPLIVDPERDGTAAAVAGR